MPPQIELDITDCVPGQLCELAGAVGAAHVRLVLPGTVPQTLMLHEQIAGIVQPDPIPPVTTVVMFDHTETLASVPVPVASDGTLLVLYTSLGGGPPSSVSAVIRAPVISAHLSCDPSCALNAGDAVGLEILAPGLIRPLQARLDTTVDGVPEIVNAPVELVPQANGTAIGTLALHAPASPGAWELVASVAGYDAPASVTTVH